MQLDQLEALIAVVEHGSFLAAARALDRRRATLQSQVDALEAELGHDLLVRGSRGAEPTRAGQAFAERARGLLAEAAELGRFLDEGAAAQQLRLAFQPGLPPAAFVLAAQMMRVRLPDTRVEIVVCDPDAAIDDPEIDLIAQFQDALPHGHHRTFVAIRFPIRLLASPAYLDARGRPETVEELAGHDLIGWTGHRPERASMWPRRDGSLFPVRPVTVTNDTHAARILANAGLGIALVADSDLVPEAMPGEELEPVLTDLVGEEGRGRILIPERAADAPAVRAFIELAREFGLGEHEVPAL